MTLGEIGAVRRLGDARSRYGANHVIAQLAAGRWQTVTPTVIALHNGPLTRRQQLRAAVLTATDAAALGAWTALAVDGLTGWERERLHLVVPRGATPPSFGDLPVVLHESRRFSRDDVVHRAQLRCTRAPRSAVDAAAWSSSARAACGILAATIQQRLCRPEALLAELDRAGRVRRRPLLRAALLDMAGGAEAVSELDFLRFCRRHGLPRPILQAERRDAGGKRRYLDATFTTRTGRSIRVEIDGALHLRAGTYWADMRRGNDLALVGETVLRFPSLVLHSDDEDAVRQLRHALER